MTTHNTNYSTIDCVKIKDKEIGYKHGLQYINIFRKCRILVDMGISFDNIIEYIKAKTGHEICALVYEHFKQVNFDVWFETRNHTIKYSSYSNTVISRNRITQQMGKSNKPTVKKEKQEKYVRDNKTHKCYYSRRSDWDDLRQKLKLRESNKELLEAKRGIMPL